MRSTASPTGPGVATAHRREQIGGRVEIVVSRLGLMGRTNLEAADPDEVPWRVSDGVIELRPPRPGDAAVLITGRDEEWERWLGPGSPDPRPGACIWVGDTIVGWVDADADSGHAWLPSDAVNVGYNVFAPYRGRGYASRAVRLLVRFLGDQTGARAAHLVIDPANTASLRVARAVGATEVVRFENETARLMCRFVLLVEAIPM
jgi:hypothetical protein